MFVTYGTKIQQNDYYIWCSTKLSTIPRVFLPLDFHADPSAISGGRALRVIMVPNPSVTQNGAWIGGGNNIKPPDGCSENVNNSFVRGCFICKTNVECKELAFKIRLIKVVECKIF